MHDADYVIRRLGRALHPERGWFKETWREPATDGVRPSGTAICYLLTAGERSHLLPIDATEIRHVHAGPELQVGLCDADARHELMLGPDLDDGQLPPVVVPPMHW